MNSWIKYQNLLHDSRAVYTCIKNPESFVHSGFSWEVVRQLPLNIAKNPNRKTHLQSRIFWNSAGFSGVFCQCKRLLQSRRVLFGFLVTWYVTFSGITRPRPCDVMRTTRVRSKVERSHACAPLTNYTSMRFRVFCACAFRAKNPRMLWV